MLFGPDWLANLFMFLFLFGLIFTIVSVLLGFVNVGGLDGGHMLAGHTGDVGDIGGHVGDVGGHAGDIGHAGHVGDVGHAGHIGDVGHPGDAGHTVGHETQLSGPSPFNMPTILAFVTWFGGVGFLLRTSLNMMALFAIPIAAISGLVGGLFMFALLARVLWPMMSKPMDSSEFRLPGTPARVVSPIREGGVGEIVYSKGGVRFTSGARAEDGQPIERGTSVVIIRSERGIAYVEDVDKLLHQAEELSSPAAKE